MLPLPLLLAVALTAARPAPPPQPVAPKGASFVLFVKAPRTGLPPLRAFLEEAGAYAPSLRPTALGLSFGRLLGADILEAGGLEEAGANVDAPLTLSFMGQGSLLCFEKKGDKSEKRMAATLGGAGAPAIRKHLGARLVGSTAGGVWRSGYAAKGDRLCLASGASDPTALLEAAAGALGKAGLAGDRAFRRATGKLAGPVVGFVRSGEMTAGFELTATAGGLRAQGLAQFGRTLLAPPREADPLAAVRIPAALTVFASLSDKAILDPAGPAAAALRFLVHHACADCGKDAAPGLLTALAPHLLGSVVLVAPRVDPSSAGGRLAAYYLFPHAYLLSLKNPEAAAAALRAFAARLEASGVKLTEEKDLGEGPHYSTQLGDRTVFVGVAGPALYLSNERGTRDLSLAALKEAAPGKAPHALVARLDGGLASSALRRVSILDVTKSNELAALFALGVEAGALLKAAGVIEGHAEPEAKGARFEVGFDLKK